MKNKILPILALFCLATLLSCSQDNSSKKDNTVDQAITQSTVKIDTKKVSPHRYGGWYCPDNLNGFPAVDIDSWNNVPVINGRLATKEETRTEASLIFVDLEKYPDAKPLDMKMPKLARFYNESSKKEEIIIVIQALNISNDSIVGFRYLNGGNGSARLNEVEFLSDNEMEQFSSSRFVSLKVNIEASQDKIWRVLTTPQYYNALQPIFDKNNTLKAGWIKPSKVNFMYLKEDDITAAYAAKLFGNQYIQIDFEKGDYQYVEKFLLLENEETKNTELQIVCGPYDFDFENQQSILNAWAQKVKELSEME